MRALSFIAASFFCLSLTACGGDDGYDAGPRTDGGPCENPDRDRDGHLAELCGGDDCNDTNPTIYPGAYDGAWSGPLIESYPTLTEDLARVEVAASLDETIHVLVVRGGIAYHGISGASGARVEVLLGGGVTAGDIAVDGEVLHVALANAGHALGYRRKEGASEWVGEVVDAAMYDGGEVAMTLDAAGEPRVVYDDDGELRYAARVAGAWTVDTIEVTSCASCRPAIAMDSLGAVHVVYASAEGGVALRHASGGPGAWTIETLTMLTETGSADLAISADDTLHAVVAATMEGGALPVTYAQSALGVVTTLGLGMMGTPASGGARIGVGADGMAQIVYGAGGTLAYATTDGTTEPTIEIVDEGADAAFASLLALDTGAVVPAFVRRGTAGNLRVLRRVGMDGIDQNCDGTDGT